VLPEGGLTLMSHGYGKHIAHAVLLATDHIDVATGKAYNCGDQITLSLRQWVQTTAAACGVEAEVVSIPDVAGELDTLTGALIDGLRRNSPSAVAVTKQLLWRARTMPLDEGLRLGGKAIGAFWGHPDSAEGPRAFAERRPPRWHEADRIDIGEL